MSTIVPYPLVFEIYFFMIFSLTWHQVAHLLRALNIVQVIHWHFLIDLILSNFCILRMTVGFIVLCLVFSTIYFLFLQKKKKSLFVLKTSAAIIFCFMSHTFSSSGWKELSSFEATEWLMGRKPDESIEWIYYGSFLCPTF